jgi:hypothetical protein
VALFEATDPSGKVVRVEAPADTSAQDIARAVLSRYYDQRQREAFSSNESLGMPYFRPADPPEETTLVGNVFRGLGAGAVGTLEQAALGIATALNEETELEARDVIKSVADFVKPELTNPEEVSAKLGTGLGSLLGLAPALLAGPAAPFVAAGIGGAAGAGEASERARADGATEEQVARAARLGVLPGLTEAVPFMRIARAAGFVGEAAPVAAGAIARIKRIIATGTYEGVQEIAQNTAQNLIQQGYSPDTLTFGGNLEAGLVGGGVGAIAQTLVELAVGGRRGRGGTTPAGQTPVDDAQLQLPAPEAQRQLPAPEGIAGLIEDRRPGVNAGVAGLIEDQRPGADPDTGTLFDRGTDFFIPPEGDISLPDDTAGVGAPRLERSIASAERDIATIKNRRARRQATGIDAFEDAPGPIAEDRSQDPFFVRDRQDREAIKKAQSEIDAARAAIVERDSASAIREQGFEAAEREVQQRQDAEIGPPAEDVTAEIARVVGTPGAPQDTAMGMALGRVAERSAPRLEENARAAREREDAAAAERQEVVRATEQEIEGFEQDSERGPQLPPERAPLPPLGVTSEGPSEPSLPGISARGYGAKRRDAVAPRILDKATLDGFGIPPRALVRKRVLNEDFNDPAIQAALADWAKSTRTGGKGLTSDAAIKINRFANQPATDKARQVAKEADDNVQLELFGDTISPSDVKPGGSGAGAEGGRPGSTGTPGDDTDGAPDADVSRMATAARNVMGAVNRTGGERTPLKGQQQFNFDAGPKRKTESESENESKRKRKRKPLGTEEELAFGSVKPKFSPDGRVRLPFTEAEIRQLKTEGKVTTERGEELLRQFFLVEQETGSRRGEVAAILSKDPISKEDAGRVARLFARGGANTKEAAAAKIFFGKNPDRYVMGLDELSFALVLGPENYRRAPNESNIEADYFRGLGSKNAELANTWVRKNLSKEVRSWLNTSNLDHIQTLNGLVARSEGDQVVTARMATAAKAEDIEGYTSVPLPTDSVVHLGTPLHHAAKDAIRKGDLGSALRILTKTSGSDRVAKIADKLGAVVGDTKVEVVKNLKGPDGTPLAGLFSPTTNTIQLDSATGMNPHTLLHETTHAAVSATLSKPGNPVTKQLKALFEDAKPSLENYYGSTSVDEFVSEVFSNPEFQAELAQLSQSGKPVSMLQRFMNIVGNYVRRLVGMSAKPLNSALNAADIMIESILAPAPTSRSANDLFRVSQFGDPKKVLDGALNNIPRMNKAGVKRFVDFISDRRIPMRARQALQYATPLHAAVEVAEKYIPQARVLNDIVQRQSGQLNKGIEAIDGVLRGLTNWQKGNSEQTDIFNELVMMSTMSQVDPELSRSAAEKKYQGDPERMSDWKDAVDMYKKIGEGGRTQYRTLRNTYKSLFKDVEKTLQKRLKDEVGGKEGQAIYDEINKSLLAHGGLDPYFPLYRTGDYWISYTATNSKTKQPDFFLEAFESFSAFKDAKAKLVADGATNINEYTNRGDVDYSKAPPTSFVNDVLKTLKAQGINPKKNATDADTAADQIIRLYLDALPERSMLQGFRRRKNEGRGTPGARKDAALALRAKGKGIVRQLAQIEYGRDIQEYRDSIKQYVKDQRQKPNVTVEQTELLDTIAGDLDRRAAFAASPNISNYSKMASSIGFGFTLGLNVSSALINLTAIPMIVVPYLAGRYPGGYRDIAGVLGDSMRMFMSSGRQRTIETYGPDGTDKVRQSQNALWSLDNYDFDAAGTSPEIKMRRMLAEVARDAGMLNRSITQDVLNMDGMDTSAGATFEKINTTSGFFFHHMERMQRQITLDMAYKMELAKRTGVPVKELGAAYKSGKISDADMRSAAEDAVYVTELTQGGVAAAGAPPMTQNNVGRVALMFKRYAVSMYYMLWQLAEKSVKGSAADKSMARKQLAGVFGATGLLAGVGGMPIFGTLAMIADMFLDDEEEDFRTATRQYVGEGVYGGLGNYIFGIDISSRVGLSDLIFRENPMAKDQSIFFSALEQLGGPVVGIGMSAERGLDYISQGDVTRGLEAMTPAAIRNVFKGIRFGTEGAKTQRGDSIVDDIGVGHSIGQALGFAPASYSRQLSENMARKGVDRSIARNRRDMLRRYYIAARNGDRSGMKDAMERIKRHNRRHPAAAITGKTIQASMRSHMRTTRDMVNGITLNRNTRNAIQTAIDLDEDVSLFD